MASVNKFIGIGNLTKDPEIRPLPSGESVANCSIACNEQWKNKAGEKQESVEFINITFYRKLAEVAANYLRKGSSVYIEGRLETKKWTDKAGVERYATGIVASEMKMLGKAPEAGERQAPAKTQAAHGFEDMDDDIPF